MKSIKAGYTEIYIFCEGKNHIDLLLIMRKENTCAF